MATRRVTLVFPPERVQEPVVFNMAKQFSIMPNIRRARVTETVGEMTLELEGAEADLTAGIRFLESRGIKVEATDGRTAL